MATHENSNEMVLSIPCRPEYVRTVRMAVNGFAQALKMPTSAIEEMEIAASEAVANAVRHAYDGKKGNSHIRIRCSQDKRNIVIEVVDKGRGFEAPAANVIPAVDFDRDGGLGIILMKCLMDRVIYVSKANAGTKVRMTKTLPNGRRAHRAGRA